MSDKPLKSAYEVAMEKLRARDREKGIAGAAPLSEAKKQEISEVRKRAQAKLAELEILWRSRKSEVRHDFEALEKAEREYTEERARVEARAEKEVAEIRERP